jgi:hypothetical protein
MRRTHWLPTTMIVLGLTVPAAAQTWEGGPTPRVGACFYQDADFRGGYFCVPAGRSVDSLPRDVRDAISSVRLFGDTEVNVFDGDVFRGQSGRFTGDMRNLARDGWNDMIRSIRVRGTNAGGRPGRGPDPDVIVRRAYDDILEREPDAAGLRLYRSRIIDEGWTEAQVREALRNSPEYREKNTMTPARARDIVRAAYMAVLQREPDPGSQTYVNRVLRDRWTQQDVERELRRSPEYLSRQRQAEERR